MVDVEKVKVGKQVLEKESKSTSLSYMKRDNCDRWTPVDLQKFYRGVQLFGTDFGMMESVIFYGKRTR